MLGLTCQDLSLIQSQPDFPNFHLFLGITEHLFLCHIFYQEICPAAVHISYFQPPPCLSLGWLDQVPAAAAAAPC